MHLDDARNVVARERVVDAPVVAALIAVLIDDGFEVLVELGPCTGSAGRGPRKSS